MPSKGEKTEGYARMTRSAEVIRINTNEHHIVDFENRKELPVTLSSVKMCNFRSFNARIEFEVILKHCE